MTRDLKMTWHRGDQCAVLAGPPGDVPISVWRTPGYHWMYSIGGSTWLLYDCPSLEKAMARAVVEARSHYARARRALTEVVP